MRHARLLLILAALAAAPRAPQPPPPPGLLLVSRPRVPRQGSLVELRVTPSKGGDSVVAVAGLLAGEPLHFEPGPGGSVRAVGGVPLDAPDTIAVRLEVHRASGVVDTQAVSLRVARRRAVVDRIATAPRFAQPPDRVVAARIAAERQLTRQVARGAHDVPRLWVKPFVRPRPRASRVTSPFGARREVNGVLGSRHPGIDIAGRKGDPVRAANRGVVALVGDFYFGGISVYVYHGAGLLTAYHHLSSAAVAIGDTVERAEVIGRVGATGRVTGPHLHWGAQYGRLSVDPADLLSHRD